MHRISFESEFVSCIDSVHRQCSMDDGQLDDPTRIWRNLNKIEIIGNLNFKAQHLELKV